MTDNHMDEDQDGMEAEIIEDVDGEFYPDDEGEEDDDINGPEGEPPADDSTAKWSAHSKDVFCVCVSTSKRWLASGSEDDTALVWDLNKENDSEPYLRVPEHMDSVNCVAFNSSSTLLATGDMKGKIIITVIATKLQRCKVEDSGDLEWILWHPSADILFAGSTDGLVWMWLISATGVSQSKVFTSSSAASCVSGKLLPDAKHLLAAHADGQVRIWNLKEVTASASVTLPSPCCSLDVHSHGNVAAIGCQDGTTTLISTQNCKVLATFGTKTQDDEDMDSEEAPAPKNSVECVRFLTEFPWLAVGTSGGTLTIYDIESGSERHGCDHDGMAVVNCDWRLQENSIYIISVCIDGAVRVWDAKTGDPVMLLSGGGDEIFDFCVVDKDDKTKLFTACGSGFIRIFSC
ncbi:WD domain, g-beta repeat domain-containing protein [Ditylenchus destructor]|uniref:WD domain, g-beta repeat domain-containing protein n=1 Tax=Ditylenchus destructor TaxID=166010 RepID=A0AAD4N529_9BILA|nr:WD domain, g-beta repeat domain-containing protein [Ditylenchus destructor]